MPYTIVWYTLQGFERRQPAASLAPMVELSARGLRPQAWLHGLRVA